MQNLSFKDRLIFCLRSRVSNLKGEMKHLISQLSHDLNIIGSVEVDFASSSSDYKYDEVVKEVFLFSSYCLECEKRYNAFLR